MGCSGKRISSNSGLWEAAADMVVHIIAQWQNICHVNWKAAEGDGNR